MTTARLQKLQALSLEKKILLSQMYIKKFISLFDPYTSFSGGKDSKVLDHLVSGIDSSIPKVFVNTTNECKEILQYVSKHDNVITLLPKMGFVKAMKVYGFPMISKANARKINDLKYPTKNNAKIRETWNDPNSKFKMSEKWKFVIDEEFDITYKCCYFLKKEPFHRYEKETGKKPFHGAMAEEGKDRKDKILRDGILIKGGDNISCKPLAFWTTKDIWEYAKLHNIRFAENYYDRVVNGVFIPADERSGCKYCLMGYNYDKNDLFNMDRLEKLKATEPKKFKRMMSVENNGVPFGKAINIVFKKVI